jgi:hypothetical protein
VGGIQTILEESRPDALLVYDACQSADTAWTKRSLHRGITELISSCGFESKAPGVGKVSFTNTFTDVLLYASLQHEPLVNIRTIWTTSLSTTKCRKQDRSDNSIPLYV